MRPRYKGIVFDSVRWDRFTARPGDIVVTTPPKCGTTWTQMICALLVFQTPDLPDSLDKLSPWLDMLTRDIDEVLADLDAQEHRRFIKTHSPYDALPISPDVTYLCVGRDPRDVFLSWDNHIANHDLVNLLGAREKAVGLDDLADMLADGPPVRLETLDERFWEWVDDERPITEQMNLNSTMHHLESFWEHRADPNVVMLHYDDLVADLEGQMRTLAAVLGIAVPEDRWPELVAAATFDRMKERADVLAPDTTNAIWIDNGNFFKRGGSGHWRAELSDADGDRYWDRVRSLASADVVEWAHRA